MLPGVSLCLVSYGIPLHSGTSWDSICWSCLLLSQSVVIPCDCALGDGAHCSGIARCLLGVPGPRVSPLQSLSTALHKILVVPAWHVLFCSAVVHHVIQCWTAALSALFFPGAPAGQALAPKTACVCAMNRRWLWLLDLACLSASSCQVKQAFFQEC